MRLPCLPALAILIATALPFAAPAQTTRASFELVVASSPVLPAETTRIASPTASAALVSGLTPGNADGIELRFEEGKGRAALVVFLDKERKPAQVNLSYVAPGATVARTVAWKPDELRHWASGFRFDGKRVVLKNSGRFAETGAERFTLAWNVDVDLPVTDKRR